MSGSSYDNVCPRCGGPNLKCYSDSRPYDTVSGECLDCGFSYYVEEDRLTLEGVNSLRQDYDLEPLEKLAEPTPEWKDG